MALFFEQFPKIAYDISNNKNFKLVTDIFRRIKIRSNIADDVSLYSTYDVPSGETPETTSFKHFGTTDYHWIILLTNNIKDRYYEWPMTQPQFHAFLEDKYGVGESDGIHHYELAQSSGPTSAKGPEDYSYLVEVNSDESGATAVTNREYEQRIQDQKRQIKILDKRYLNQFIEEFDKLIQE